MSRIHVIPHTHWDQEWYFTQQDSSVLASYNFIEVIETLESSSAYPYYHLDGQTAIIDDFLAIKPDYKDRIKKLVTEKRLFIGPWFTQTDTYNVHGESIIRNLKYGILYARSLGHSMNVAYLPDTFGHNAQLPTLFRGFGLDSFIFWRGIDHDEQVKQSNFIWRSIAGDSVLACNMRFGYGAAKNIQATRTHLEGKIFPMAEKMKALSTLEDILLPSGGDQVNIDSELPSILEQAMALSPTKDTYFISSFEHFIETIRPKIDQLESFQGELKAPRYTRIHKTIGSVRYDIKQLNYQVEQFLLKKLEPVVAIAQFHGIPVNTEWVDSAWKTILRSHAHDSIGGCNSDATNQDILHRLKQSNQTVHSLWNIVVKELASSTCSDGDFMVFNAQPRVWSGVLDIVIYSPHLAINLSYEGTHLEFNIIEKSELPGGISIVLTENGEKEVPIPPYYCYRLAVNISNVPSMGYCIVQVTPSDVQSNELTDKIQNEIENEIENERYRLSYENDNLTLYDKRYQRIIPALFELEECADEGDSYDFSPRIAEQPLLFNQFELESVQHTTLHQEIRLKTSLCLPLNRDERGDPDSKTTMLPVTICCTLQHKNPNLSVEIVLNNTVCDHRLRLKIRSDIQTDHSIASLPFAIISRPIKNDPGDWMKMYRESPIDIETTEGIIAISEPNKSMVINALGIKEFQVLEAEKEGYNQVALTLFKSVGVLGRDNLQWRPGRASGINNTTVYTPDAQLQQTLQFNFTLALEASASHYILRDLEAEAIARPSIYQYQTLNTFEHRLDRFSLRFNARNLPERFSLFSLPIPLMLSATPHALTEKGICVRLFNAGDDAEPIPSISPNATIVDYLEAPILDKTVIKPFESCDFLISNLGVK